MSTKTGEDHFAKVLQELEHNEHRGDLVTIVFISHYLERMGDCLLNIGEALIFVLVGEKMNIRQYQALNGTLGASGLESSVGQVEFESILLKYLPGCTMQNLIINGDDDDLAVSEHLLEATLGKVWWATKEARSPRPDFVGQIRSRQEAVYRMHPEFQTKPVSIGKLRLPSFNDMLDALEDLDPELAAPYAMRTHGDLNLNNVIFDPAGQNLHFIDLHRSAVADCAQDISVFLISSFRLPVFDPAVRRRINSVMGRFLGFALDFARNIGDEAFQAHLALGLHLMSRGVPFVSNDRLMFTRDSRGPVMNGLAKLPRINPGTALNNPDLKRMMSPEDQERFAALPEDELWALEHKYDVDIDACFETGRIKMGFSLDLLALLDWERDAGPCRLAEVELAHNPGLLASFMKEPGLFYLPPMEQTAPSQEDYLKVLAGAKVFVLSGRVDFTRAADLLSEELKKS